MRGIIFSFAFLFIVVQLEAQAPVYHYVRGKGGCFDSSGKNGLNPGYLGECGDWHGADLSNRDLSGLSFLGADLSNSNLGGSDLRKTDFREANLTGANLFQGAQLNGALFSQNTRFSFDFKTATSLGFVEVSFKDLDDKLYRLVSEVANGGASLSDLKTLLDQQADPNYAIVAIFPYVQRLDIVEIFLMYGMNPNGSKYYSFLSKAVSEDNIPLIKLLLTYGASLNDESYAHITYCQSVACVQELVKFGASIQDVFSLSLSDEKKMDFIFKAYDFAKSLNADLNGFDSKGRRPLEFWLYNYQYGYKKNVHYPVIQKLLQMGADPNLAFLDGETRALCTVAGKLKESDLVTLLLSHGADPTLACDGLKKTSILDFLFENSPVDGRALRALLKFQTPHSLPYTQAAFVAQPQVIQDIIGGLPLALVKVDTNSTPIYKKNAIYKVVDAIFKKQSFVFPYRYPHAVEFTWIGDLLYSFVRWSGNSVKVTNLKDQTTSTLTYPGLEFIEQILSDGVIGRSETPNYRYEWKHITYDQSTVSTLGQEFESLDRGSKYWVATVSDWSGSRTVIKVLEPGTAKILKELPLPSYAGSIGINSSGDQVYIHYQRTGIYEKGRFTVFDVETGKEIEQWSIDQRTFAQFHYVGSHLYALCGNGNGALCLIDFATSTIKEVLSSYEFGYNDRIAFGVTLDDGTDYLVINDCETNGDGSVDYCDLRERIVK